MEYLSSPLLETPHGFSTRLGGVSAGHLASLNLGCRRGDREEALRENYRRFCAAVGVDVTRLVMTNQVHGRTVRAVTTADVKRDLLDPTPFEADGLTCDVPGVALVIFSADCVPILFFDKIRRVAAACHAGWRGTAAAIAAETVAAMSGRYGCRPRDIRAAIGPAIGPCCFETHGDVPRALAAGLGEELVRPFIRRKPVETGPSKIVETEASKIDETELTKAGETGSSKIGETGSSKKDEKFFVDLKGINRAVLMAAGVPAEHIDVSGDCTCCLPQRYWSHRYTGGVRGSQAAVIGLEG